jgi:hypothetical protein
MPPINIGDLLPQKEREELAILNLKIGAVLKFYCNKAKKEKIFIFIAEKFDNQKIGLVHINSEVNPNVNYNVLLRNEHIDFQVNENRYFLSHNSYINCSDLIIKDKKDIIELLTKSPKMHLGFLNKEDYILVHNKVANSAVIVRGTKKEFGISYEKQ